LFPELYALLKTLKKFSSPCQLKITAITAVAMMFGNVVWGNWQGLTSTHAMAPVIQAALTKISRFFKIIKETTEQLTQLARWRLILSAAFRVFLNGKMIGSTGRLVSETG